MDKPRIFLGSSGKQEKLLRGLTRGLEDVAHVEPWTTSFNPGTTTLERLVELAHEVDFAAFAFAQDDWTTTSLPASPPTGSGQASPRDNVVFEAGLFGGVLGMRRTFILHASGAKLPSDLLGLTCVRVRRSDERCRDESHQREASEGNRERGPRRTHRRPVVAVLPDGAQHSRAFRREPPSNLATPRRGAGAGWTLMARGWQAVSEILVRSVEGEARTFGHLLLLEGGTASGSERTAAIRDRRNPAGVRRPRGRILHDSFGHACEREGADGRCFLARRS